MLAYKILVDGFMAAAFGVALLSARNAQFRGSAAFDRVWAGFSFSLYAVHYPVMIFIGAGAHDWLGVPFSQPLGLAGFATAFASIAIIVVFAWVFSLLTERQTPAVRDALTRLVSRYRPRIRLSRS